MIDVYSKTFSSESQYEEGRYSAATLPTRATKYESYPAMIFCIVDPIEQTQKGFNVMRTKLLALFFPRKFLNHHRNSDRNPRVEPGHVPLLAKQRKQAPLSQREICRNW